MQVGFELTDGQKVEASLCVDPLSGQFDDSPRQQIGQLVVSIC